MNLAKHATRLIMTVLRFVGLAALLLAALPMVVFAMLHSLWRRIDLWAFYNGDEAKRRKAEWDAGR